MTNLPHGSLFHFDIPTEAVDTECYCRIDSMMAAVQGIYVDLSTCRYDACSKIEFTKTWLSEPSNELG